MYMLESKQPDFFTSFSFIVVTLLVWVNGNGVNMEFMADVGDKVNPLDFLELEVFNLLA